MAGIRLSSAIRLHYLQQLFSQSVHVLDSMSPGYAVNTITSTSNTLQLGISEKLGVFFEYNATIIAALVVAFHANWKLSFVVISVVVFIILTVFILMPFIARGNGRMSQASIHFTRIRVTLLNHPFLGGRKCILSSKRRLGWCSNDRGLWR